MSDAYWQSVIAELHRYAPWLSLTFGVLTVFAFPLFALSGDNSKADRRAYAAWITVAALTVVFFLITIFTAV